MVADAHFYVNSSVDCELVGIRGIRTRVDVFICYDGTVTRAGDRV